ncbi:hypothetical protein Bhyg_04256 [Pseudolycoriella hygida]|uniref:Uncharacterized protein n=1 Tax=Pseudolycoriella hygida TaxID=35572 RepID=A0A9Q0NGE9_9DIPT|nr:hypothetical protein Bhyg_04256 [Pseudolycoriella hygida]
MFSKSSSLLLILLIVGILVSVFAEDGGEHHREKRAYCSAFGCDRYMCSQCCYNRKAYAANGLPCLDFMRARCC